MLTPNRKFSIWYAWRCLNVAPFTVPKTKTKVITTTHQKKVDVILRELKVDTDNLLEARENTSEQVGAGLSLAFNWLR